MASTAPVTKMKEQAHPDAQMEKLRAVLAMTRPTHIALTLPIFANGVMLAVWRGSESQSTTQSLPMWPALLLLVLAAAAVHLANEAADHETDRLTVRTPFSGGSGALAASGLDPGVPLLFAVVIAVIVVGGAVVAAAAGVLHPAATVLLIIGLAGGLAYSLPPVAAQRRGWGEPLNAVLGAMVLPLCGVAALAATITLHDVIAFLPFLFVVFASVLATAWPDRAADAATGKMTLQVRLEPDVLRRMALAAAVAFFVATFLSAATGAMPLALAGLIVAPLLAIGLTRYARVTSPSANVAAMVGLALITTGVLLIVVAGLVETG